jgi:purine-binding chemotaxis protein CheW
MSQETANRNAAAPESQEAEGSRLLAVFSFHDSLFALEALQVQEIIRVGAITAVHRAPRHVLGIINLRGRIVTVMDPACRMGLESQKPTPQSRVLIIDWQDEQVGLLVSRIHDMVDPGKGAISPAPSNLQKSLGAFLKGVVQIQEHMVSVLDLGPLLSAEEAP